MFSFHQLKPCIVCSSRNNAILSFPISGQMLDFNGILNSSILIYVIVCRASLDHGQREFTFLTLAAQSWSPNQCSCVLYASRIRPISFEKRHFHRSFRLVRARKLAYQIRHSTPSTHDRTKFKRPKVLHIYTYLFTHE